MFKKYKKSFIWATLLLFFGILGLIGIATTETSWDFFCAILVTLFGWLGFTAFGIEVLEALVNENTE